MWIRIRIRLDPYTMPPLDPDPHSIQEYNLRYKNYKKLNKNLQCFSSLNLQNQVTTAWFSDYWRPTAYLLRRVTYLPGYLVSYCIFMYYLFCSFGDFVRKCSMDHLDPDPIVLWIRIRIQIVRIHIPVNKLQRLFIIEQVSVREQKTIST